jgi:hypothetical protein
LPLPREKPVFSSVQRAFALKERKNLRKRKQQKQPLAVKAAQTTKRRV